MKTQMLILAICLLTGCTQIITAPIKVAGAITGAAIDIGAAGVHAVTGSDDEDKK
jgi:uncharacterized protein YceK